LFEPRVALRSSYGASADLTASAGNRVRSALVRGAVYPVNPKIKRSTACAATPACDIAAPLRRGADRGAEQAAIEGRTARPVSRSASS
jgi:hypothetical protein